VEERRGRETKVIGNATDLKKEEPGEMVEFPQTTSLCVLLRRTGGKWEAIF